MNNLFNFKNFIVESFYFILEKAINSGSLNIFFYALFIFVSVFNRIYFFSLSIFIITELEFFIFIGINISELFSGFYFF